MRRSYWAGIPGLTLLAMLAVGASKTPASVTPHPIRETVARSTTCPHGGLPFSEAAQKVPVLNNLPDGGTITFTGTGFHSWYDPCSWSLSFTAPPPMSLLSKVLAVAPGRLRLQSGATNADSADPIGVFCRGRVLQWHIADSALSVSAPERWEVVGGRVSRAPL